MCGDMEHGYGNMDEQWPRMDCRYGRGGGDHHVRGYSVSSALYCGFVEPNRIFHLILSICRF